MGFFDGVLKALGFETEEKPKKEKIDKKKKNKTGEFDLQAQDTPENNYLENRQNIDLDFQNQFEDEIKEDFEEDYSENNFSNIETQMPVQPNINQFSSSQRKSGRVLNVKPENQGQVQASIDELKNGANIIIDLSLFESSDLIRALDFVSGACYCLGVKINKINSCVYSLYHN